MSEEHTCVLVDYEGRCESLCYVCNRSEVCAVSQFRKVSDCTLWVNYCSYWAPDKFAIEQLESVKLIKRKEKARRTPVRK